MQDQNASARFPAQSGSSLAEVVVGIGVMMILFGVASPLLPSLLEGYSLLGASREVYGELQRTRMAAVMANHRYRFTVIDSHQYKVHKDEDNDGVEDAGESVTVTDIGVDSPGVTVAAATTITFAANGGAPTSGTVILANPNGSRRVVVSPAGRIRIE